jgi:hypothetical protein
VDVCATKGAIGGGDCLTPITACTGDAIECIIAAQTFATRCSLNPTTLPTSDLGTSVIGGAMPAGDPRSNVRDVDLSTALDQTNSLGNACPADRVIALPYGKSLSIPYSSLCPYLQFMGHCLVAMSLIAALHIVFGKKK